MLARDMVMAREDTGAVDRFTKDTSVGGTRSTAPALL